jgi:hypothetical protein
MTYGEIPKYLENLFGIARLHGWCEEVHEGINELTALNDESLISELRTLLETILQKTNISKEEAILSLILLRRLGVPEKDLYEHTYRTLKNRLYFNDFRFLIRYFFHNKVPLPQSLVYDITERVFFSLEDVYNKIVDDFTRVPFRNAEPVIFFLILQNCRVDLNTQNKELLCIILTHIEIKLPDSILDDIITYLDENASLEDSWRVQREIIKFDREHIEQKSTQTHPSTSEESFPQDSQPPPPLEPSSPRLPDQIVTRSLLEGTPPQYEKEKERPLSPDISPREEMEKAAPPPPQPDTKYQPSTTESGYQKELPDVLKSKEHETKRGEPESPFSEASKPTEKREEKSAEEIKHRGKEPQRQKSVTNYRSISTPEEKEKGLVYDQFMEPGKERGIFLERLSRGLWQKNRRSENKVSEGNISLKRGKNGIKKFIETSVSIFKNIDKKKRRFIILGVLLVIAIAIVILFTRSHSSTIQRGTTEVKTTEVKTEVRFSSTDRGPTVAVQKEEPFIFQESENRILWKVKEEDTFYRLYTHLRSNPHNVNPRLVEIGNTSWNNFLARIEELNPGRFRERDEFDKIFPSETFILFSEEAVP